jgi:putative N-acetylmannosamine-6-phosphate epimerase
VLDLAVLAKGRVQVPEQAGKVIALGACAVVGNTFADATILSSWFVDAATACSRGGFFEGTQAVTE